MGPRLLLCISAVGVSVAQWRRGLVNLRQFAPDEDGEAAFTEFLSTLRNVPVYILVDSVEEDYRFDTLPHAAGRDRREMVERKLKQLYRTTPYATARLQARERSRRRDDRYLFAAITDVEVVEPWVGALVTSGLPIAGIFPLPAITPAAVGALGLGSANLLIVSKHVAGLRQTFIKDGRFRFSRLTPFRGLPEGGLEATFAAEITNTRLYLNALQATTADDIVDVVVLDQDDSLRDLHRRVSETSGALRAQYLSRAQLQASLKIGANGLDPSGDALHLHLLGRTAPVENIAPPDLLEGFRVYRTGRWLLAAAAGVAVVAVLWFAVDLNRVRAIKADTRAATEQTQRYQALYTDLTRQFPSSPVSSTVLKQTVDVFDRLRETARTPEMLFAVTSSALDASPTVTLESLSWKLARVADLASAFNRTGNTTVAGTGPLRQIGLIKAEIQPFTGDYRSAVGAIREFADRLRRHPRVAEARILKLPLDDSSKQSLSGSTSARAEAQVGARFEIAIVLREAGDGS